MDSDSEEESDEKQVESNTNNNNNNNKNEESTFTRIQISMDSDSEEEEEGAVGNKTNNSKQIQKSPEEIENEALRLKELGNKSMQSNELETALKFYTQSLELSPNGPHATAVLANRALTHLQLKVKNLSYFFCDWTIFNIMHFLILLID